MDWMLMLIIPAAILGVWLSDEQAARDQRINASLVAQCEARNHAMAVWTVDHRVVCVEAK